MVWIFSIIGMAASVSVLYGLMAKSPPQGQQRLVHLCVLGLVAAAWWTGHHKVSGWITLSAGVVVEIAVIVSSRRAVSATPALETPCESSAGTSTEATLPEPDVVPPETPPRESGGPTAQNGSGAQSPPPSPDAPPIHNLRPVAHCVGAVGRGISRIAAARWPARSGGGRKG